MSKKALADLTWESKMSAPERAFYNSDYLALADELGRKRVEACVYEPVSFKLPGGSYTPDFMLLLEDGRVVFVEVKVERRTKSGRYFRGRTYRDSRSKIAAAAAVNPWFTFYWAFETGGGSWRFELVEREGGVYVEDRRSNRR